MRQVRTFLKYIIGVVGVLAVLFVFVKYYSYIFSQNVEGEIYKVERVTQPTMILGNTTERTAVNSATAMHSFAVAVKSEDGTIYTASSEDRQWAVAAPGCKVKTKFYPYPFWDLEKSGTYFNARLIHMRDCPGTLAPQETAPEEPLEGNFNEEL